MKSKFHNLLMDLLKPDKSIFFFFLVFHNSSFITLTSKFGWLEVLNFLILEVSGSPDGMFIREGVFIIFFVSLRYE